MAVTNREQAILDRADAGMKFAQIARELGVTPKYALQVVRAYTVDGSELLRERKRMAQGSKQLLNAIVRARAA